MDSDVYTLGFRINMNTLLFAYYMYLFTADRDRGAHWMFSDSLGIPHAWYKEFDIDLGEPVGDIDIDGNVWTREFNKAIIILNPTDDSQKYVFKKGERYLTIQEEPVGSDVMLKARTGILLMKM